MIPQLGKLATLCAWALPGWLVLRSAWWLLRRPQGRVKPLREAAMALLAVFMTGVLIMALEGQWAAPGAMLTSAAERLRTMDRIHLRPLQTIWPQVQALPSLSAVTQLMGNTLLFAPWGFFLPLLWPRFRHLGRIAAMALGLTLLIETTQLFVDRFVEIDDVLLNFLGGMLGAGVWAFLHRPWPGMDRYLL